MRGASAFYSVSRQVEVRKAVRYEQNAGYGVICNLPRYEAYAALAEARAFEMSSLCLMPARRYATMEIRQDAHAVGFRRY